MNPLTEKYDQARVSTLGILAHLNDGKISALVAARKLVSLRFTLVGDDLDEDWRTFVAIDSETDDLPTGEERKHWSPEALAAKDVEIRKAEEFYLPQALEAAKRLIQRYETIA